MNTSIRTVVFVGTASLLGLLSVSSHSGTAADANSSDPARVVDSAGNIRVPAEYRTSYQFLGSWAVAAGQGRGSNEIHTVYASPGVIAGYRKDGRFPDGSVLVKEVFETATEAMTTGTVSHSQTLKGWFVMVRDSSDGHPGNKLWGDGWGWSWFDAGDPRNTTSTDYKVDCQTCHLPAQASDWIYVKGYPVLAK
jgi:hypothetical protein